MYKRFQDPPFFVNAMIAAKEFYGVHKITYAYRIGHTQVKWNTEKLNNMLLAIIDNLKTAKNHNLKLLQDYSSLRFIQYYKGITNYKNSESESLQRQIIKLSTLQKKLEIFYYIYLKIF